MTIKEKAEKFFNSNCRQVLGLSKTRTFKSICESDFYRFIDELQEEHTPNQWACWDTHIQKNQLICIEYKKSLSCHYAVGKYIDQNANHITLNVNGIEETFKDVLDVFLLPPNLKGDE